MTTDVLEKLTRAKYDLNVAQAAIQTAQNDLADTNSRIEEALILLSNKAPTGAPVADGKYNQYGFTTFADEEGAVQIKKVDDMLVSFPKNLYDKVFRKFYFEQAYQFAVFPDGLAKQKAHRNLSWRLWTVFLFPPQPSDNAVRFEVVGEADTGPVDYFRAPEARARVAWRQAEVRFDAASMDWNPSKDAEWVFNWWKGEARAEAIALGLKPEDYGL